MSIAKSSGKKQVRYYHVHGVKTVIRCGESCGGSVRMDPKVYEVRRLKGRAFVMDNSQIIGASTK